MCVAGISMTRVEQVCRLIDTVGKELMVFYLRTHLIANIYSLAKQHHYHKVARTISIAFLHFAEHTVALLSMQCQHIWKVIIGQRMIF